MNIRSGNVRVNPLSRTKIKALADETDTLENLLRVEGVETCVQNTDFREILASFSEESTKSDSWRTAWIVISRSANRAVGVLRFVRDTKIHEVFLTFPEQKENADVMRSAFLILCEWAAGYDRVYTIRTSANTEEAKEFLQAHRFCPGEGNDFIFEKPHMAWLPIMICLGLSVGCGLGLLLGNMIIGTCLGILVGFFAGNFFKEEENKERAKHRKP